MDQRGSAMMERGPRIGFRGRDKPPAPSQLHCAAVAGSASRTQNKAHARIQCDRPMCGWPFAFARSPLYTSAATRNFNPFCTLEENPVTKLPNSFINSLA